MKKIFFFFFLSILLLLSACEPTTNNPPEENNDTNPYTTQDFFNLENFIKLEILISDDELENINQDYLDYRAIGSKSPIYRMCDLRITINEDTYNYDEVGIRMKGNTSRSEFFTKSEGIFNLIHFKLSFSETFDNVEEYENPKIWTDLEAREFRKDRTFLGMEKLDLKWNKSFDATEVKEIFAYDLFRNNGLYSPHATLGQVLIGNQSLGIYHILETVDKTFINRYLPEEEQGGNLYKVGWNNVKGGDMTSLLDPSFIGIEDESVAYFPIYDLKTNKKTNDNTSLINLLSQINTLSSSQLEGVVDQYFDMDYWTSYEAVNYLIGNPDDIRNHYNNYYLYFLPSNQKAIIIPYDYDRPFGITKDWNPTGNAMVNFTPNSLENTMCDGTIQQNPFYLKILLNEDSTWNQIYLNKLNDILASDDFTMSSFTPYYEKAKLLYEDLVQPDIENISNLYIDFSLNESEDNNRTDVNLSMEKYIELKRATIENA